jgi:hypothetical protein
MTRTIETLEGVQFSKTDLETFNPLNCLAYFFSDREVALLVSVLRYAEWPARWEDRDADLDLVFTLEDKLMAVCNIELQLNRIASALYVEPDTTQLQILAQAGVTDVNSIAQLLYASNGEQADYTEVLTEVATVLGYVAALA